MFAVLVAVTFLAFSATNVIGDPLFNVVGFYAFVDCVDVIGTVEDLAKKFVHFGSVENIREIPGGDLRIDARC